MNRRGEWIQIFLVLFFFLLLLVTLFLLFVERGAFESEKRDLDEDLMYQRANTVLVNLLRTPVDIDISGDGGYDSATLGDLVVMNNGDYDELIEKYVTDTFSDDVLYQFKASYANGRVVNSQRMWDAPLMKKIWHEIWRTFYDNPTNLGILKSKDAATDEFLDKFASRATLQIADVTMEFFYADQQMVESVLTYKDVKELRNEAERIIEEAEEK